MAEPDFVVGFTGAFLASEAVLRAVGLFLTVDDFVGCVSTFFIVALAFDELLVFAAGLGVCLTTGFAGVAFLVAVFVEVGLFTCVDAFGFWGADISIGIII